MTAAGVVFLRGGSVLVGVLVRPGHRLPHAWLEHRGQRVSTHDLTAWDGFALLTGPAGDGWVDAAAQVTAKLGVAVCAVRIGAQSGVEYLDVDGGWAGLREVSDAGAVLVRPDNHVAFRAQGAVDDPTTVLSDALAAVLGR